MNRLQDLQHAVEDESSTLPTKASSYSGKNFLTAHRDSILDEDEQMCQDLIAYDCTTPQGTIFDNKAFAYLKDRMHERNETAVLVLLSQVLVPSAEIEHRRGRVALPGFIDSFNEPWTGWIPLGADTESLQMKQQSVKHQLPRPQPDYSVGFLEDAFGKIRMTTLAPFLGDLGSSAYKGTLDMLFPFFTSEAKSAKRTLLEADHQNAHSMTCALRGVVRLFQLVKREKYLHQRILGFSVDYHRYEVNNFSFTTQNGRDRETCYKFVMAMYNDWVPKHFERLCSPIDQLPVFDVDVDVDADGSGSGDAADTAAAAGALGGAGPFGAAASGS
ncbi:hypothetical protein BJX65DRAFT_300160 [Aspergillus insuetus]